MLETRSIDYNRQSTGIYSLPADVYFVETENQLAGLLSLSAEEAASTILNAFSGWNKSILDKVLHYEVSELFYKDKFLESRLISVGMAFTSGLGNSIFVPYTLELKDGTVKRHNLVLQKNDSGGWIVVGGL